MRKNKIWIICISIVIISQIIQISPKIECPGWNPLKCSATLKIQIREGNNEEPVKSAYFGFPYLEIGGILVLTGVLIYSAYHTLDRRKAFYYNKETHQCFDKKDKKKEINCPDWIRDKDKGGKK